MRNSRTKDDEYIKEFKRLLDEICQDYCPNSYCILKEIALRSSYFQERLLVQFACIELFKWDLGKKNPKVTWDDAGYKWVETGYAATFARIHDTMDIEDIHPKKLYKEIQEKNIVPEEPYVYSTREEVKPGRKNNKQKREEQHCSHWFTQILNFMFPENKQEKQGKKKNNKKG